MEKVLVIDDDLGVLRLIKNILNQAGYQVEARSEVSSIDLCDFIGFDLILLDIMMPVDGFLILEEIREEIDTPIIFITAKDMSEDIVEGIQAGADDYITKPFKAKELVARVMMHIRRDQRKDSDGKLLDFGQVCVDLGQELVLVNGERLDLSKREFSIIRLLASQNTSYHSVEELYERVYPQDSDTLFRSISEYVYQIRAKFKKYKLNPIETKWGGGYRWKLKKLSDN